MEKFTPTEDHRRCIERVKRLREALGYSQIKMAGLVEMKPTSYSDLEAPAKRIDLDKIITLANYFDVPVGFLAAGERANCTAAQLKKIQRIFDL